MGEDPGVTYSIKTRIGVDGKVEVLNKDSFAKAKNSQSVPE